MYPLAIWLAEDRIEPRVLALMLLLAGVSRLMTARSSGAARYWLAGTGMLVLLAISSNAMYPLKLYPVIVNATLLGLFGYSLVAPPSAAERIARMREPHLPPRAISYTRRVTQVWCIFFLVNGTLAFYTALYASSAQWSLYNGLLAYVLMGILFAGEYVVRRRFMSPGHG
ncbi:MAG TPA: hypothetical protein VJQ55_14590 [Candidatus Binatia bacterium]|nr:hypothetical protein [Candidatus Binatia bacterium]